MTTQILMPALSPTMEEGTLSKWFVKEGDAVEPGDLLAEIETDKATMEFEAVSEGTITKLLVADGATGVKINAPIAEIDSDDGDMTKAGDTSEEKSQPETQVIDIPRRQPVSQAPSKKESGERIFASPLARRLAKNHNIKLSSIKGSGHNGRIIKRDIESCLEQPPATPDQPHTVAWEPLSMDQVLKMYQDREFELVELKGMRSTIATRLTEAKQTIPHFYLRRSVTLDSLLDLRAQINDHLKNSGAKISINDFIIAAVAKALQSVPAANVVWASGKVLELSSSDIAVAVAVEGGLFTPVIKDAQNKSLTQLSSEMRDLAARARERKLHPMEYVGGSVTISNLGMYGIENFDAIINPPHASILAVGASSKKTDVNGDGDIIVTTKMSVTLSVDHRMIDGAIGAGFLDRIIHYLEHPLALLVDQN